MPKQSQRAEVNNFTKGLITEASLLNFPPNAASTIENFEINRTGGIDRRLGLSYENGYQLIDVEIGTNFLLYSRQTYTWKTVAGIPSLDFLVVQIGSTLRFFDIHATTLSDDGFLGSVALSGLDNFNEYSLTSVEGYLVVATGSKQIAIVNYDSVTEEFSYELDTLKTRDVWGVEETFEEEDDHALRLATITNEHRYNLYNQSWGISRKDDADSPISPLDKYFTDLEVYPSNSEVVWTGLQYQPVTGTDTPFERIYTNLYDEVLGADIKAAKGYFIIDLLDRGASRAAKVTANATKYPEIVDIEEDSLPIDSSTGGAKIVCEFAGRVFYAGFNGEVVSGDKRSPHLANYVFFSKLIKSRIDFMKCHQEGDPTSRDNAEVVDTDGGFVRISGANNVIGLINLESAIMVVCDNGVWSVTGGSDYGFSATNFKVSKITSFGGLSTSSFIVEGGRAYYWSQDGIYVIVKDQFGDYGVQSLSATTIQSYYDKIPPEAKASVKGIYDPYDKKIRWMYKEGSPMVESTTWELIFDVGLAAFFVNRIRNLTGYQVEVFDIFVGDPYQREISFDPGFVPSEDSPEPVERGNYRSARYFTAIKIDEDIFFCFALFNNPSFRDWQEVNGIGIDARAFLLTGAATGGESAIDKQVPYLTMHFKRTENALDDDFLPYNESGCLMRCQWDWAINRNSNRWTPLRQVYKDRKTAWVRSGGATTDFTNAYSTVTSKNKIRGHGKAFSLYLQTQTDKDCRILGWVITANADSVT